jgi:hypothetical protein
MKARNIPITIEVLRAMVRYMFEIPAFHSVYNITATARIIPYIGRLLIFEVNPYLRMNDPK